MTDSLMRCMRRLKRPLGTQINILGNMIIVFNGIEFKGGFIRNFDFGHYIVIPAISPLLMNKEVLLMGKEDFDKINQILIKSF